MQRNYQGLEQAQMVELDNENSAALERATRSLLALED
jgi:hypothetical protein